MVKASKSEEVYSYIKKQILAGEWKEGDRLNDAQLAEEIGVSRATVREALFRLVESGVVSKEYWKGYFIKEVTDEMVAEIVQIRVALESCGMRNFMSDAPPEVLDTLQEIINDCKEHLKNGQTTDYLLKDYSFHETIYQNQHNRYVKAALDNLQPVIHFIRVKSMGTDADFIATAENSIFWHQRILSAIKTGNADYAVNALLDHLEVHRQEAMYRVHTK